MTSRKQLSARPGTASRLAAVKNAGTDGMYFSANVSTNGWLTISCREKATSCYSCSNA